MNKEVKLPMADDDKYPVKTLALMRIPPLAIGLGLGFVLSFATSRFEEVMAQNVQASGLLSPAGWIRR